MSLVTRLIRFNRWRRGDVFPMPDVREIGEDIDSAVAGLRRLESLERLVKNLLDQKGRHNTQQAYERLANYMHLKEADEKQT